jgi:hypothetical protein
MAQMVSEKDKEMAEVKRLGGEEKDEALRIEVIRVYIDIYA